jgi:pimeloyl-ACP methyl ester carboxylesterase
MRNSTTRHRVLLCLAFTTTTALLAADCSKLSEFKMPGVDLEITANENVPAAAPNTVRVSPAAPGTIGSALPAYCRVEGIIDKRIGVGGKQYGIRFALALPEQWNGRFLFQGGGGLNGTVNMPLGAGVAGNVPALARGFAIVSTDTGHQGAVFDGSFFQDQQATLDFHYVANGRVTVIAKELIASYYGRKPEKSYFIGCSTGGREAMIMAQRYPSYFDGLVAGAPAMRTGHSNLALAYIASVFTQVSPQASQMLSDSDRKLVVDSLLSACDAKDGVRDGMIFDTKGCDFDPAVLTCKGAKSEGCLSAEQVAALKKGFAGPKDSCGNQVYPGFPYDPGIGDRVGLPGLLHGSTIPVRQANTGKPFDVTEAAARLQADASARLGDSTWTNLSSFSGHGGRMLFYHGMADPWFSALDTLGYYEKVVEENGGRNAVESWCRLFLVPGMGHCGGGAATLDRFDLLTVITEWVEKGAAPEAVIATGKAFPGRSRPLCAYPKYAHYTGQGDSNDAKNFVCKE